LMAKAEALFGRAEEAVHDEPELLGRVQVARLPIRYVWAMRWFDFQAQARRQGLAWPGPDDYVRNASTFMEIARASNIPKLSEGRKIESFEERTIGLGRVVSPPPPGCEDLAPADCVDLQDASFRLAREGTWAKLEHDDQASDPVASRMPGDHYEWATQQDLGLAGMDAEATYTVYASLRCEKPGDEGLAFTYGLHDVANRKGAGGGRVECKDVKDDQYHTFKVATGKLHARMYIWVAPPKNPDNVKAVWVDRFWLVREE